MTKENLLKKIAQLETANDQLLTEITHIDHLMRLVGFADGIRTIKATAEELIVQNEEEQ